MKLQSEKMKELRTELGMTQYNLADITGISQTAISDIEQGRADARLSTVNKLAEALNTTAEVLLGYEDKSIEIKSLQTKCDELENVIKEMLYQRFVETLKNIKE